MTFGVQRERPVVVFVSDAEEFAGAERYMVLIIEALRERYDFVIVVGDGAAQETRDKAGRAGARAVVVRGLRRQPAPGVTARLAWTLRGLQPALIHVNATDQGDASAALLGARFLPGHVLATLHNALPNRAQWKELISTSTLRTTDVVIAVSDRLGLYLESRGIRNVVVKNGLRSPQLDSRARDALGLEADALVVGGIGRLHRQKGWDILCRAAALVHETRPEIRFVVIGEGRERQALQREPSYDHIDFRGYLAEASSLLGAFDILAIPSRYEGLGLVAIEGLMAGIPIVAADVEGLSEVVGDCGVIVPPRARALAKGILALAGDDNLRRELAERGRERAQRLFLLDRMVEETAAVYDDLLNRKQS